MLPEHREQFLSDSKDKKKINKPILDENKLEEIDDNLHLAIEFHYLVKFSLWIDGFNEDVTGHIHYIDVINKHVRIVDLNGKVHRIENSSIIDVNFIDY
nr:YolD-like family protein [Lederbergia lenta]